MSVPQRDDQHGERNDDREGEPRGGKGPPAGASPTAVINAPTIAILLAAGMLVPQVVRTVSLSGWQDMVNAMAVISGYASYGLGDRPLGEIGPLFLHPFLHQGWAGAAISAAAVLAMGGAAARPFGESLAGSLQFLAYFCVCAAVGALADIAFAGEQGTLMMGDWTAVSGCIAGAGWAIGGRAGAFRFAGGWLTIMLIFFILSYFGVTDRAVGEIASLLVAVVAYPLAVRLANPAIRFQ